MSTHDATFHDFAVKAAVLAKGLKDCVSDRSRAELEDAKRCLEEAALEPRADDDPIRWQRVEQWRKAVERCKGNVLAAEARWRAVVKYREELVNLVYGRLPDCNTRFPMLMDTTNLREPKDFTTDLVEAVTSELRWLVDAVAADEKSKVARATPIPQPTVGLHLLEQIRRSNESKCLPENSHDTSQNCKPSRYRVVTEAGISKPDLTIEATSELDAFRKFCVANGIVDTDHRVTIEDLDLAERQKTVSIDLSPGRPLLDRNDTRMRSISDAIIEEMEKGEYFQERYWVWLDRLENRLRHRDIPRPQFCHAIYEAHQLGWLMAEWGWPTFPDKTDLTLPQESELSPKPILRTAIGRPRNIPSVLLWTTPELIELRHSQATTIQSAAEPSTSALGDKATEGSKPAIETAAVPPDQATGSSTGKKSTAKGDATRPPKKAASRQTVKRPGRPAKTLSRMDKQILNLRDQGIDRKGIAVRLSVDLDEVHCVINADNKRKNRANARPKAE